MNNLGAPLTTFSDKQKDETKSIWNSHLTPKLYKFGLNFSQGVKLSRTELAEVGGIEQDHDEVLVDKVLANDNGLEGPIWHQSSDRQVYT